MLLKRQEPWLPEDRTSNGLYNNEVLSGYIRHGGHMAAQRDILDQYNAS